METTYCECCVINSRKGKGLERKPIMGDGVEVCEDCFTEQCEPHKRCRAVGVAELRKY
jgi:hypothetical protein